MAVGIQSRAFALGARNVWAEPGVGVVVSQASTDAAHGPAILSMLRVGTPADRAVRRCVAADPDAPVRQIGAVDARGLVGTYTGACCLEFARHRTGDGYSVQANLTERETVCDAMAEAFERTPSDLLDRVLAALEAAEQHGGDLRGAQSAALAVVDGSARRSPWERVVDLRVDDHPTPTRELARLVGSWRRDAALRRALMSWDRGDHAGTDRHLDGIDLAEASYLRAATAFVRGDHARAEHELAAALETAPGWAAFASRADGQFGFSRFEGLLDFLTSPPPAEMPRGARP